MITRSKAHAASSTKSKNSSATVRAQQLSAEAQHLRRIAELERAAREAELNSERAIAEAEHRAQLAALEANEGSQRSRYSRNSSRHSSRHWSDHASPNSKVRSWLKDNERYPNNNLLNTQVLPGPSAGENVPTCQNVPLPSQPCDESHVFLYDSQEAMPDAPIHTGAAKASRMPESSRPQPPDINTNTLGTLTQNCNINKFSDDTIQNLARAITDAATAAAANRRKKVSYSLPNFDGKSSDWLVFKKIYDETSPAFTNSENLVRINASLRGNARDSVSVLLAAAGDPIEVIHALEAGFARPEQIILNEIASVRALTRLSNYESVKELNAFAVKVRNCTEVVRLLRRPEYLASPELSNEIVGKLTPLLRVRWADYASGKEETSAKYRLELLSDFLMQEANLRSKYQGLAPDIRTKPNRESCHTTSTESSQGNNKQCSYCKTPGHVVRSCEAFISLPLDKKWEWVSEEKVCRKCLIKGAHQYRTCKKFSCKVKGCRGKLSHHTLLHKTSPEDTPAPVEDTPAKDTITQKVIVSHNHAVSSVSHRPWLKIVAVTLTGPKGKYETFALLDDGFTATLVDSSVCEAIGAEGQTTLLRVDGIGGMSKKSFVSVVDLEIKGLHSSTSHILRNVRLLANLNLSSQSVTRHEIENYNYLTDILQFLCYEDAKPMILIGIDNWHLTFPQVTRRGSSAQLVASLTSLGWVLYGSIKGRYNPEASCDKINYISSESDTQSLDDQLKDYFKIDSIGISKAPYYSLSDAKAIQILESTAKRLPTGRFETGLIWRSDIASIKIPNTYELALSRFLSLERKMKRDEQYAEAYRSNIHGMISKGYAELCKNEPKDGFLWYLPHFGVFHPQKKKLRVVHDAAASCQGISLNSLLLAGPDFLQPLLAILMRFREGCIALNGDIREMFPQTKIRCEDRNAQRFLWRDNPSEPIREYRMSSMMFGAVSSPFTALYLKNLNAEEHKDHYPAAAKAIVYDHYMDDYVGSVNSVEEARKLASEITYVHSQACLEMRSWVSNDKDALSSLPPTLVADESTVKVKILGVCWNLKDDVLKFFRSSFLAPPTKLTKRSVLSHLMRLYDPLGLLTPLSIKGRILFQKTWSLKAEWDQELPFKFAADWNAWFSGCEVVMSGSVPRHYLARESTYTKAQLHVFADASELAYACVAFWRFERSDGSVKLSLIGGKARLAPLKPISIPRLELQAALIAARFANYIAEAHNIIKISKFFFWCDSQTVLKWLRCDARTFKPYVAHCVGEIAELTNVSDWHYVPKALNVADDATRDVKKFEISSRWFTGPNYLLKPQNEWPTEPSKEPPLVPEEMKRIPPEVVSLIQSCDLPTPVVPDATRFSRWFRLVRSTARVHVCAKIFKTVALSAHTSKFSNSTSECREPTAVDIKRAECQLFLQSQLASLKEDYINVMCQRPLAKTSRLKNLTLHQYAQWESTMLLRLSGRIGAVENVAVAVNPIVLFGKDRITRLLIAYYHERASHSNNELVVNEIRQTYHVIGLRPAVRSVASSCLVCRLRKAKPTIPRFGDLPPERLAHHVRPFTFVGLDYFGPVSISIGRRNEKRYVALFTCLTVRAVHFEIVGNLSTDSAIMALRRFISRRGSPSTIYSDNGTAFVGASRLLNKLHGQPVKEYATNLKIEWKFTAPSAPFMGGSWERLVRSVKTALSATLFQRSPTEEVFSTLLLEAESLINSRPLTHVSVDPGDEAAITPFHFLLGTSSPYSVVTDVEDSDLIRRVRWRKGLRLADHFWSRWVKEYLPTLIERKRGSSTPDKRLEVGDLVLIVDGNLPRGVWPRGRVARTFPGKDGVVRAVDVITSGGTLRRPTRKLVPLS